MALGVPAVGKSTYAQKLAYEFEVLHLRSEEVIQEILGAPPIGLDRCGRQNNPKYNWAPPRRRRKEMSRRDERKCLVETVETSSRSRLCMR